MFSCSLVPNNGPITLVVIIVSFLSKFHENNFNGIIPDEYYLMINNGWVYSCGLEIITMAAHDAMM